MALRLFRRFRQFGRGVRDLLGSEIVRETGADLDRDEASSVPKAQLRRRKGDGTLFVALKTNAGEGPHWLLPTNEEFRHMVSEFNSLLEDLDRRTANSNKE